MVTAGTLSERECSHSHYDKLAYCHNIGINCHSRETTVSSCKLLFSTDKNKLKTVNTLVKSHQSTSEQPFENNDLTVFAQLDGNVSISSDNIQTKTVKQKVMEFILPSFTNYNCRSFAPKANSFAEDMENRDYKFSFLTEIWQDDSKKTHRNIIQKLLEENDIKYISTPRRGNKRGGGAAIAWNSNDVNIEKLNVNIPPSIEAVWGLYRPKNTNGSLKKMEKT